jgi:hypothetical protein
VTDVRHEVVAVASSSSAERATTFIEAHGVPKTAKAYGSYEELVAGKYLNTDFYLTFGGRGGEERIRVTGRVLHALNVSQDKLAVIPDAKSPC